MDYHAHPSSLSQYHADKQSLLLRKHPIAINLRPRGFANRSQSSLVLIAFFSPEGASVRIGLFSERTGNQIIRMGGGDAGADDLAGAGIAVFNDQRTVNLRGISEGAAYGVLSLTRLH
jgi:hypothetical protein